MSPAPSQVLFGNVQWSSSRNWGFMILKRGGGKSWISSVYIWTEEIHDIQIGLYAAFARVHACMLMGSFKKVCVKVFWVLFLKSIGRKWLWVHNNPLFHTISFQRALICLGSGTWPLKWHHTPDGESRRFLLGSHEYRVSGVSFSYPC